MLLIPLLFPLLFKQTHAIQTCWDPSRPIAEVVSDNFGTAFLSPREASLFIKASKSLSVGDWSAAQRGMERSASRREPPGNEMLATLLNSISPYLVPRSSSGYRHRRLTMYSNAEFEATAHARHALADSRYSTWAYLALAQIGLGTRNAQTLEAARSGLRQIVAEQPLNITSRVALADVLIAMDSVVRVPLLLNDADNCVPAQAALGESLILLGRPQDGARLYLHALASADSTDMGRFIEDVSLLARSDLNAQLSRQRTTLKTWLLEFWDRSGATSGQSAEERLAAHIMRTWTAQQAYRNAKNPTLSGDKLPDRLMQIKSVPWDIRGEMLVLHGQPDTMLTSLSGLKLYIPENETWVYARGADQWALHFTRWLGPDWHLSSPFIGCGGNGAPPDLGLGPKPTRTSRLAIGPAPGALFARDYYLMLAPLSEYFELFAQHCGLASVGHSTNIEAEIQSASRDYNNVVDSALDHEDSRAKLKHRMRIKSQVYGFSGRNGSNDVYAFAWIPAADFVADPPDSLTVRFAMVGREGAPLRAISRFRAPPVRSGDAFVTAVAAWQTNMLPDASLYVFARETGDSLSGAYSQSTPWSLKAKLISSIVISDGGTPTLKRRAYALAPAPGHIVQQGRPIQISFELYDVMSAEEVNIEMRISPSKTDKKIPTRTLNFRQRGRNVDTGVTLQEFSLSSDDLLPGDYSIAIVASRNGHEVEQRTGFTIVRR